MRVVSQSMVGESEWSLVTLSDNVPLTKWHEVRIGGGVVKFSLPSGRVGNVLGVHTSRDLVGREVEFV